MKETILTDRGRQTCKDEEEKRGENIGERAQRRTLKRHKKGTKHKTQDTTQRHRITNHDTYIYFPQTTSGYDAEHVHITSLVNHGEACSEWNLSC